MHDRSFQFGFTQFIARAVGALSLIVLIAAFWLPHGAQWGHVAILLGMLSCTAQVRVYFCALSDREQNAFQMGRDSVRSLR